MALLPSELAYVKYALGFNLLTVGAVPYIGIAQIFEQVIQPYMGAGTSTTSSTAVTAVASGLAAAPVTLTLATTVGIATFDRLVVDVDGRQESATVQSVAGSTVSVLLSLDHSGTYPVTVEGGEAMVRTMLVRLRSLDDQITASGASAGIKKVDEIEFFGEQNTQTQFAGLTQQKTYWRTELCKLLFGVGSLAQLGGMGGGGGGGRNRYEVY